MRYLFVIAVILSLATPASAQLFCDAPREPSCISTLSFSRDQFTFDMCRSEMETYQRRVRQYLACLQDESSEALRRLNAAIERFNRCARDPIC